MLKIGFTPNERKKKLDATGGGLPVYNLSECATVHWDEGGSDAFYVLTVDVDKLPPAPCVFVNDLYESKSNFDQIIFKSNGATVKSQTTNITCALIPIINTFYGSISLYFGTTSFTYYPGENRFV